jgi:hypothetical protein
MRLIPVSEIRGPGCVSVRSARSNEYQSTDSDALIQIMPAPAEAGAVVYRTVPRRHVVDAIERASRAVECPRTSV